MTYLGLCGVDELQLTNLWPLLAEATGKSGCIRFHRCSQNKWWQYEPAGETCDCGYTLQELSEWLPGIKPLNSAAEETFTLPVINGVGRRSALFAYCG